MVDYVDRVGKLCNMVDGCTAPSNEEEAYNLLDSNFNVHYKSNRAPFPIFMHAWWFAKYPYALSGMFSLLVCYHFTSRKTNIVPRAFTFCQCGREEEKLCNAVVMQCVKLEIPNTP